MMNNEVRRMPSSRKFVHVLLYW